MFEKIMNNYYYGKSGKGDFTPDDLPTTRMQLFWEMLRIRFSALVRLNLMQVVVWLPLMIVLMFSSVTLLDSMGRTDWDGTGTIYAEKMNEQGEKEIVEIQTISPQEFGDLSRNLIQLTLLLLVPCITITGPVTAGVSYVVRNWARDEHAFIWADFRDAIKANWKQSLLVSFLTSLFPLLGYSCWTFYGELSANNPLMFAAQVLTMMLVLIWTLAVTYMHPLLVSYELKFSGLMRNALLLAVARLPMSVGVRLLHLVPLLLGAAIAVFFNVPQHVIMVLFMYYLIIGFSLSRFITASYTNGVFDKYINSQIEGAQVNRGLRTTGADEDDDDDEDEEGSDAESDAEDDDEDDE